MLTSTLDELDERYTLRMDHDDLVKRVDALESFDFSVLEERVTKNY